MFLFYFFQLLFKSWLYFCVWIRTQYHKFSLCKQLLSILTQSLWSHCGSGPLPVVSRLPHRSPPCWYDLPAAPACRARYALWHHGHLAWYLTGSGDLLSFGAQVLVGSTTEIKSNWCLCVGHWEVKCLVLEDVWSQEDFCISAHKLSQDDSFGTAWNTGSSTGFYCVWEKLFKY